MLHNLVPKIFYANLDVGVDLFVDGLRFELLYQDDTMAVVERDNAKAILVEDADQAAKDRPELAIENDEVDALHADIAARRPDLLHPDVGVPTDRPWGAREFALLD